VASEKKQAIASAGIIISPLAPAVVDPLAGEIADMLRRHRVEVWESAVTDGPGMARRVEGTDLLITLGGDGSILRAARHAAGHDALILGINLGRIGFLTEAEPDGWREALMHLLQGDYWIEERMMLRAEAWHGEEVLARGDALNDVVVGKGPPTRVVHLQVHVDGDLLTNYVADGLITATPTGSTAYALSAGGPIMPPQQRNILLVPVAPHLSLNRAVVLAEGVQVKVVVRGHSSATLILDGEMTTGLTGGDAVHVKASPHTTRFARTRERDYFYRTLMARLVPKEQS